MSASTAVDGGTANEPRLDMTHRTNDHYDDDPRIFALFLDPTLKYSSALFEDPSESLDQAVARKLDFVFAALGVQPGDRVLDIGCGWGSLVLDFARRGLRVTGLTPSPRQRSFIVARHEKAGRPGELDVRVGAFERSELQAGGFDAITMLGSIVHMPDQAWVLRECRRLLRPGGRLYISESCFRTQETFDRFDRRPGTDFVRNHIFGYGAMWPLSRLILHTEEAGFSLASLTDLTESYRLTIDHWRRGVLANQSALDELRPGLAAELTRYFDIANAGWGFTTKHYAFTAVNAR